MSNVIRFPTGEPVRSTPFEFEGQQTPHRSGAKGATARLLELLEMEKSARASLREYRFQVDDTLIAVYSGSRFYGVWRCEENQYVWIPAGYIIGNLRIEDAALAAETTFLFRSQGQTVHSFSLDLRQYKLELRTN